jgi:hypothetical protein
MLALKINVTASFNQMLRDRRMPLARGVGRQKKNARNAVKTCSKKLQKWKFKLEERKESSQDHTQE